MIAVLEAPRSIAKAWRICREVRTSAGIQTRLISFQGAGLTLHAATAELALERARILLPTWRCTGLVAIPEAS